MQSTSTSKPPGTTHPLALLFVTATLLHAALAFNKTDALLYHVGVAHTESVQALPGSRPSTVLRDEPGEDAELQGVPIYDSVHDIPPYKVRGEDGSFEKCFRGMHQFCLKASFCGYDCEQILLAVHSFCEETVVEMEPVNNCREGTNSGRVCRRQKRSVKWKRCEKARKYNRCFPRICYRRVLFGTSEVDPFNITATESHAVQSHIAIVRYKKPPPRRLAEARRKRQSRAIDSILGDDSSY